MVWLVEWLIEHAQECISDIVLKYLGAEITKKVEITGSIRFDLSPPELI